MILNKYLKYLSEKAESEVNYNVKEYFNRLYKAIKRHNIETTVLGTVREYPILFLHPKKLSKKAKVMIAAGFHGDESSGPWAVLNFLEYNKYPTEVDASFIALANPTGFDLSRRADFWGIEPNRAYVKSYDSSPPAREDDILRKKLKFLSVYGKDALVTLHEDDEENFYIFTYGEKTTLDIKLLKMGEEKFGLVPKKRLNLFGLKSEEDGIRINDKDGSFEHGMLSKGSKISITVENPAHRQFKERVELYIEMIKEICKAKYY